VVKDPDEPFHVVPKPGVYCRSFVAEPHVPYEIGPS
jgi:hypothetical protein